MPWRWEEVPVLHPTEGVGSNNIFLARPRLQSPVYLAVKKDDSNSLSGTSDPKIQTIVRGSKVLLIQVHPIYDEQVDEAEEIAKELRIPRLNRHLVMSPQMPGSVRDRVNTIATSIENGAGVPNPSWLKETLSRAHTSIILTGIAWCACHFYAFEEIVGQIQKLYANNEQMRVNIYFPMQYIDGVTNYVDHVGNRVQQLNLYEGALQKSELPYSIYANGQIRTNCADQNPVIRVFMTERLPRRVARSNFGGAASIAGDDVPDDLKPQILHAIGRGPYTCPRVDTSIWEHLDPEMARRVKSTNVMIRESLSEFDDILLAHAGAGGDIFEETGVFFSPGNFDRLMSLSAEAQLQFWQHEMAHLKMPIASEADIRNFYPLDRVQSELSKFVDDIRRSHEDNGGMAFLNSPLFQQDPMTKTYLQKLERHPQWKALVDSGLLNTRTITQVEDLNPDNYYNPVNTALRFLRATPEQREQFQSYLKQNPLTNGPTKL